MRVGDLGAVVTLSITRSASAKPWSIAKMITDGALGIAGALFMQRAMASSARASALVKWAGNSRVGSIRSRARSAVASSTAATAATRVATVAQFPRPGVFQLGDRQYAERPGQSSPVITALTGQSAGPGHRY